jgi:hypothetical protein
MSTGTKKLVTGTGPTIRTSEARFFRAPFDRYSERYVLAIPFDGKITVGAVGEIAQDVLTRLKAGEEVSNGYRLELCKHPNAGEDCEIAASGKQLYGIVSLGVAASSVLSGYVSDATTPDRALGQEGQYIVFDGIDALFSDHVPGSHYQRLKLYADSLRTAASAPTADK